MFDPLLEDIFKEYHPLVNPNKQKLLAASNFVNGEVVGRFYYTFTHTKFFNFIFQESITDNDYTFELISNNPAFAVSSTGIITIADITQFTSTQTLTIRCHAGSFYHQDGQVDILYIPASDVVYLDFTNDGFADGSRTNPYKRFRSYQSANPDAVYGKTFLYKSGTATTLEYMTITNAVDAPYTNFGRWGTGARPIIKMDFNTTAQRFMDFGRFGAGTGVVGDRGHNVRVIELEFTHNCSNDTYMFQVQTWSRNLELWNIKFTGVTFRQGFLWARTSSSFTFDPEDINCFYTNIECYDFREQIVGGVPDGCRAMKLERYGNRAENIKCVSTWTGLNSAPVSAVDMPGTHSRFLYMDTSTANNGNGPNIRVAHQTYRNCYIKGPDNGLVIVNNTNNGYQVDYPIDETSFFESCLVENSTDRGVYFANTASVFPATAVGLRGLALINCGKGIEFMNNIRNVIASGCLIIGSTTNGVLQSNGVNNKLVNCTVINNDSTDINVSSGSLEVINTIFESSLGTLVQTTNSNNTDTFIAAGNYRLADESVLIGAGTTTTTTKDLLKNNLSNPPSIGAFEYVANTVQPEILTIKGLRFTLV